MPQKVYLKDQSFDPFYKSINYGFYFKSKILSGSLMAVGFLVLSTQVVMPLIFFKTQDNVAKPMRNSVLGVAAGYNDFEFKELQKDASGSQVLAYESNVPKYFHLSIPKLGIKDALVETNSKNLSPETYLGHYNGSALPGQAGNTFVYGHSVLPWFFNPKNYKTIFSTLDTLKTGDEVIINYNNMDLSYKVEDRLVQNPGEVNPLASIKPKYLNESTLTLMTCYPAGTKAQRLSIYATRVN
jgi:LPXTG-site transpeptidase (sortase) family protein